MGVPHFIIHFDWDFHEKPSNELGDLPFLDFPGFLRHLGSQDFSKSSALKAQGRVAPSNFSTKTSAPDR